MAALRTERVYERRLIATHAVKMDRGGAEIHEIGNPLPVPPEDGGNRNVALAVAQP